MTMKQINTWLLAVTDIPAQHTQNNNKKNHDNTGQLNIKLYCDSTNQTM